MPATTRGADAILVLTEWDRYTTIDWQELAGGAAPGAMVFDGRSVVDQVRAREAGFQVFTVGIGDTTRP